MIRNVSFLLFLGAALVSLSFLFFGNSSLFPLDIVDFFFFAALTFSFALYRPGWAFLILLSLLPFEMIRIAPDALPLSIRPYQMIGAAILFSLFFRFLFRRDSFPFTTLRWFDSLPILCALGGFLSLVSSPEPGSAAKQALVVLSFVALFFLSRQFFSGVNDARRVLPFLALAASLPALFALWQNIRFTAGLASFEIMPGRPNAFFPEPDWLGMFLIFSGSMALALLFSVLEKISAKEKEGLRSGEKQDLEIRNRDSSKKNPRINRYLNVFRMSRYSLFFILYASLLTLSILGLLLTVARSAWIGFAISSLLFLKLLLAGKYSWNPREWRWKLCVRGSATVLASSLLALLAVWIFRLTPFELAGRAKSTASGLQEITVSCESSVSLPEKIGDLSELPSYGCQFIRIEEIDPEKNSGKFVATIFRPDPSIEARRIVREKTFQTLKEHWLLGIGWGNIGSILGTDDRGATLNASNAFLEVWLGGGLLSFAAFLVLWMLVPVYAFRRFFFKKTDGDNRAFSEERAIAVFFLLSWVGFTVFNLFNSGILLGFVWIWLGGMGIFIAKTNDKQV